MRIFQTLLQSSLLQRILMGFSIFLLLRELKNTHREINRISQNQQTLTQTQRKILLSNGAIAYQSGILQLKQQEFATMYPALLKELEVLNINTKNVQSISTTAYEQQAQFTARLNDSISIVPHVDEDLNNKQSVTTPDTLAFKTFKYHDAFYDVSGYAYLDSQYFHIKNRDTMTQVVYRKRTKPWLWIFSPTKLEQHVYFKNPNTQIQYSQTINIQR